MTVQNWSDVIVSSLQNLWNGFVGFLPNLLGALIVLIVGIIVAAGLGALVEKIFASLRFDTFLSRIGLAPHFERAGLSLKGSRFLGRLVYWFIVIAFLLAAANILQLNALSNFLQTVLLYIPNVIVAVLILFAAAVVANFLRKVVQASVMSTRLGGAHFLGTLTYWAVVIFGLLAALDQLGVVPSIINAVITGVIAMFALAGGLAFGLGGRDYAAHLLNKFRQGTEG
jgi:hypothetical protein